MSNPSDHDLCCKTHSQLCRGQQPEAKQPVFVVRPYGASQVGFGFRAKGKSVTLAQIATYPVASTPLSDEVARVLVERYGALAHPEQLVQLRCEEVSSLLDVARNTNTVVLAVRSLAPDLVELPVVPTLNANARFGWVSLKARTESPLAKLLQEAARDLAP